MNRPDPVGPDRPLVSKYRRESSETVTFMAVRRLKIRRQTIPARIRRVS